MTLPSEVKKLEKVISLPSIFGRNWKGQVILPFSPIGTQYGNRYPIYKLVFEPEDVRTAIILWDFLYEGEGGAIDCYTMGNITIAPMSWTITGDLVRLGVASVRGNLPHFCKEHPLIVYLSNTTGYEVDLVLTAPSVMVTKEAAEDLLKERVG